jgi:hypothetical protein
MTRLPSVSGERLVRALKRAGCIQLRQKGSQVSLEKRIGEKTVRTAALDSRQGHAFRHPKTIRTHRGRVARTSLVGSSRLRRLLGDVCLHGFERRGIVRKALRAEVGFQFVEQGVTFGLRGTFERDTLLVVRRIRWRCAKIRATHAAQARQYLPYQLIVHQS